MKFARRIEPLMQDIGYYEGMEAAGDSAGVERDGVVVQR